MRRYVIETADDTAVGNDEEESLFLAHLAVRLDGKLHRPKLRQFTDALQVVCHLAQCVLQPHIDLMRDIRHDAGARDVDEVFFPDAPEINAHRLVREDALDIRFQAICKTEVRRKIVRRAAADDREGNRKFFTHDHVDDFMHCAVTARDKHTLGLRFPHIERKIRKFAIRAVEDKHAAECLEAPDHLIEPLLERCIARDRIIDQQKLSHPFAPSTLRKMPMRRKKRMLKEPMNGMRAISSSSSPRTRISAAT